MVVTTPEGPERMGRVIIERYVSSEPRVYALRVSTQQSHIVYNKLSQRQLSRVLAYYFKSAGEEGVFCSIVRDNDLTRTQFLNRAIQ